MKDSEVLRWLLDQLGESREDVETTIKHGGVYDDGRLKALGGPWEYPFIHEFTTRVQAESVGYYAPRGYQFRRSPLLVGPVKGEAWQPGNGWGIYFDNGDWR